MIAYLIIKKHSERVPEKNFRELGGKLLFRWILDTLQEVVELERYRGRQTDHGRGQDEHDMQRSLAPAHDRRDGRRRHGTVGPLCEACEPAVVPGAWGAVA